MKQKTILLALAAVSAVMFALPAVASAGEWTLDPASGKFPQAFSVAGSDPTLTQDGSSTSVTCTEVKGSGKYTNGTTGEDLTLTFHGCRESSIFHFSCTSEGQPSGTIVTTALTFHNVMLEATGGSFPKGTPGVLLTPNAGHFASFSCAGIPITVNGNGIMADVSAPECGGTSKTATLNFESVATGTQKWTQITTGGTKFDLTSNENGTVRTASQDGSGTVTFGENETMTCP